LDISALKEDDYQVWVPFLDAEVLVRYVPVEEIHRINRSATRVAWDRKNQKTETLDAVEANRLLGRAAVRGWRGITMDGEEVPYSVDNCDFLMDRWLEFFRFVGEVCLHLRSLVGAEKRGKEKNSVLTSGHEGTSLG
jgi:hypothetical protein